MSGGWKKGKFVERQQAGVTECGDPEIERGFDSNCPDRTQFGFYGMWELCNPDFTTVITDFKPDTILNLPKLTDFSVDFNRITDIKSTTFSNLPKLRKLFLNSNRITDIKPGTFSNLPELTELALNNNNITEINPSAFSNLPKLRTLYLTSNHISVLPQSAYDIFASISTVKIAKNPWQCDCRMAPFRLQMNGSRSLVDQIVCSQPAMFSGHKLKDIDPKNLVCNKDDDHLENDNYSYNSTTSHTSHYHWHFNNAGLTGRPVGTTFTTLSADPRKPENNTFHESDPRLPPVAVITSVCGSMTAVVLIATIIHVLFYKRRGEDPKSVFSIRNLQLHAQQGLSLAVTRSNIDYKTTAVASGDDHQYENMKTQQYQTEQGVTGHYESLDTRNITYNTEQAASEPNPVYKSENDQTGQGQTQAIITGSSTNTTACVVSSDLDHRYEDMNQHNQTGQYQPLAITGSNIDYKTTAVASGDDHQYKNMKTQQDQTEQGVTDHYESLDTRNITYNTEQAASEPNPVYKSENDQTGQGQTQAIITGSNTNTTACVVSSDLDHRYEDMNQHNQTGQYQPLAITGSNIDYKTTAVASGDDHQYENPTRSDRTGRH
ncbi:hypothetical protein Bbelb_084740 [Branchiostoma belcheri]|nr:hypothetical protein Bbelb_084740 [Branchiostoma belcheri]